jgi:hypothetical protein
MALLSYLTITRRILKDVTFTKFIDGDLVDWINIGRGQLAGESECIRVYAPLTLTPPAQQYNFSAIGIPTGVGLGGVLNVRMVTYTNPGTAPPGAVLITPREWEFFNTFVLAQPSPVAGPPDTWAQHGQGINGTIFVNAPDLPYVLNLDTVCVPSSMSSDSDPEPIPGLWVDAIPYYAAYLAMLTNHEEGAENMLKLYEEYVRRARQFATPSVLSGQYSQAPDMMMASRLGITRAA